MPNSRNKFDTKDSLEIGEHAESAFILLAVKLGWKISASSNDENIDDHWDYLIEKEDAAYKVEVKGKKRINRKDEEEQDRFIWVELKNVRGKVGWLFGRADLIAFENDGKFVFVKRRDLLDVVNKKVNLVAKVKTANDAVYKIYMREGRRDKLTLLPAGDIEEIKFMEWKKS